jgi:hypothetical protein
LIVDGGSHGILARFAPFWEACDFVIKGCLINVRQDVHEPTTFIRIPVVSRNVQPARRQDLVGVVVGVTGEAKLPQVVLALEPVSGLTASLHGSENQANHNRDDCDHYKQFKETEGSIESGRTKSSHCIALGEKANFKKQYISWAFIMPEVVFFKP